MKVLMRSFLFFVLCNFTSASYSQNNNPNPVSNSISSSNNRIIVLAKSKDYKEAIKATKEILNLYEVTQDSIGIAKSYHRLGFYSKKIYDYKLSFAYLNTSFNIYSRLRDSIKSGKCLVDMSNIQRHLGDFINSETIAIDALRYLEHTKEYMNIAGAYHSIAINKKERGDFEEAEEWNKKTLELLNDSIIKKTIPIANTLAFLNTKANIQVNKGNYDKAIKQYQNLLKDSLVKSNKKRLARTKDNLGFAIVLKDSASIRGIQLMNEAIEIRKDENDISGLIASNIHLAKYYAMGDELDKAIQYGNDAFENAKKIKNPVAEIEALEILINLKNRLELAVNLESDLFVKATKRLDDIRNANRSIYEVSKYKNDKLREEKAQKDLQISKSRSRNILLLFGILLLSLVSIVAYYLQKQKAKQKIKLSKLQERYQTETRLSKKMHDEVGNDIFYLMTQIEKDPSLLEEKGLKLLDGLQTIYSKARDISREYTAIDTGEGFSEELLALLNSFGNQEVKIITRQLAPDFWNVIKGEAKAEIFRIVQELLTNMKKHSKASHVAITFKKDTQNLTIQYADNGIGVEGTKPTLRSVENRIEVLKGVLTFDSQSNEGLNVSVVLPI